MTTSRGEERFFDHYWLPEVAWESDPAWRQLPPEIQAAWQALAEKEDESADMEHEDAAKKEHK